jgi:hypothetical protein
MGWQHATHKLDISICHVTEEHKKEEKKKERKEKI